MDDFFAVLLLLMFLPCVICASQLLVWCIQRKNSASNKSVTRVEIEVALDDTADEAASKARHAQMLHKALVASELDIEAQRGALHLAADEAAEADKEAEEADAAFAEVEQMFKVVCAKGIMKMLDTMGAVSPNKPKVLDADEETLLLSMVQNMFEKTDVDGSGQLDKEEVSELCVNLGLNISEEQVTQVMAVMDADGSGEVDFDEFFAWYKAML